MGAYGERFGRPEFEVRVAAGRVTALTVRRGAPCGATWPAAARLVGLPAAAARERIGLEVQFGCAADPSAWDPLTGRSPVHLAAELHAAALHQALRAAGLP